MSNLLCSLFRTAQQNFVCSTLLLLIFITSLIALLNRKIFHHLLLHPYLMTKPSQSYRLITAGLVHSGYQQMAVNLISLAFLGKDLEHRTGHFKFAIIFLVSLIAGNLITFYAYRKDFTYTSAGASGGVLAVMVSYILFFPTEALVYLPMIGPVSNFFILLIYVGVTIRLVSQLKETEISHELHLLGCLAGIAVTLLFYPSLLRQFFTIW